MPCYCLYDKECIGWYEVKEEEQELPKLTAEVFDRPDCPEWAKYAAVDKFGKGFYFQSEPAKTKHAWRIPDDCKLSKIDKFDPYDWENSLITRPAKALPDWVQECAIGYDNEQKRYFRVTDIDKKWVDIEYLDDGIGATCSYADMQNCSEARKRPFYDVEMQRSVGRVFTTAAGDVSIASDFDNYPKILCILGTWFDRKELADSAWLLDGKPCYVLEHLVDGEWVK
jgi:hypothetical protein